MMFLRCLIFNIIYVIFTFYFCFAGCLLWILPSSVRSYNARLWGVSVTWFLKVLVGINIKIEGEENLPTDTNSFIVASKHQSALETLIFHFLLKRPAYILKKELLYLPFFGWNLLATGCIPIDRSSGTKAMRSILNGSKKRLSENRPVIIFPEGTRTAPETDTVYNPGVGLLYDQCKVPVIPVALNTGYFWGKKSFMKKSGTVTVKILPAMPENMNKRDFMAELKKRIEEGCQEIKPNH